MIRRGRTLLQVLMLLLPFGCSRGYADANLEMQAAALLVQRYETVVSARSTVLSQLHFDNPNREFGRRYLGLPFVYLMGGLKAVGPKTLGAVESISETVLTGAKDFAPPTGLGMASSRTCYIVILAPGSARTLAAEFGNVKVAPIDGRPVWTWSMPPSEGYKTNTTLYAAIVANSFVFANNEDDFRGVVNALASTVQADVLSGPDLRSLRAHAYWAYRAIRRSGAPETAAPGLNELPVSAIGLELFTQFDDDKLFLNILVTDDRSSSTLADLPSSESIRFQRAGAGVWQAVISLTTATGPTITTRQTTSAVFQALSYFGYVVVL